MDTLFVLKRMRKGEIERERETKMRNQKERSKDRKGGDDENERMRQMNIAKDKRKNLSSKDDGGSSGESWSD